MTTAREFFLASFKAIETNVAYNPAWENGTGYLDHAVTDETLGLKPGEIAKTESLRGRKIIIVSTRFGNIIVFERYTTVTGPIVSNVPEEVTDLLMGTEIGTVLDLFTLRLMLGDNTNCYQLTRNLGAKIEELGKKMLF